MPPLLYKEAWSNPGFLQPVSQVGFGCPAPDHIEDKLQWGGPESNISLDSRLSPGMTCRGYNDL